MQLVRLNVALLCQRSRATEETYLIHETCAHALDVVQIEGRVREGEPGRRQEQLKIQRGWSRRWQWISVCGNE